MNLEFSIFAALHMLVLRLRLAEVGGNARILLGRQLRVRARI
jgi:hypothetical protein